MPFHLCHHLEPYWEFPPSFLTTNARICWLLDGEIVLVYQCCV